MTSSAPVTTDRVLPTRARLVAVGGLIGVTVIMGLKFLVFGLTGSTAVLGDALESLVNIAASTMVLISTCYASRPPDREHPYGHGNIEFVAVAVEGMMIAGTGVLIAYESMRRLVSQTVELQRLEVGLWLQAGVMVLMAGLAWGIWQAGRKLDSPTLMADGRHLGTDVVTTVGTLIGLAAVKLTGLHWLDPLIAIGIAMLIMVTGWRLMRESWSGIMDRIDEADDQIIRQVLAEARQAGQIESYHKLRHRHQGSFHWVEVHLQVNGEMTVSRAHDLASAIEHRIETALGRANATAHIEPAE